MPTQTFSASDTYLIARVGDPVGVEGLALRFVGSAFTGSITLRQNQAPPGSALNLVNVGYRALNSDLAVAAGTAITGDTTVIVSDVGYDLYAVATVTAGTMALRVSPANDGLNNRALQTAREDGGYQSAGQQSFPGQVAPALADLLGQAVPVPPPNGTDDTTAIQRALDRAADNGGGAVVLQAGVYRISAPLTCATNGVSLHGTGPFATDLTALASFSGSACIIFGNKATTTVTTSMAVSGMTIDVGAVVGVGGVELYGLRDSSGMSDVYVKDNTNSPGIKTNQAGNGTGAASSRMCEGVQFRNCWVIGGPWLDSSGWQLDGLFESTVIGGGARSFSSVVNTNARGFVIGDVTESRGVRLYGVGVTMIKDTGTGVAQTNAGIQYGQWARDCTDFGTTFEGITGPCVDFDGSDVSGAGALPFNCASLNPRVYVYAQAGNDGFGHDTDYFFNPSFRFGVSSYCRVDRFTAYSSWKVWAAFGAGGSDGQQYNSMGVVTSRTGAQLDATNVTFDADAATTNWVDGWALGSTLRLTSQGVAGGTTVNATETAITLGSLDNMVWYDSAGNPVQELSATQSIPRVPARNVRNVRYNGGYSASITPNMAQGAHQVYAPNDAVAFTINAPTNPATGDWLYLRFRNISGGALGDITFNAAYKVASANPWTLTDGSLLSKPANGYSRIIAFAYDGTGAWVEAWRSPADVPN